VVAEVKCHVLDVGQGACNYVEIIDDNGTVIHNMLIDLGTNSAQAIAQKNVEWLREKIKTRPDPRIDVLVLTHGDTDHYNLMLKLLPALNPADTGRIGMVRYGGVSWRYKIGKTALITDLERYCDDVDSFTPSATSYDQEEDKWKPIWDEPEDGDVRLQLIVANTPHPKDHSIRSGQQRANPEAVNTKSVVLGIEWDGYWMIATGDATATTIAEVNAILEFRDDDLPKAFMLTLPHHGSRKTTYDLKVANDKPGDEAKKVVDAFLDIFMPRTVSISAGEKRHHHPSMLMVEQFAKYTDQSYKYWSDPSLVSKRHFLTCWVDLTVTAKGADTPWPGKWMYATTQTGLNIYSTLYFKNEPYIKKYAKSATNGVGYSRYLCPPVPAGLVINRGQKDVPMGRNWTFSMDAGHLSVQSTGNPSRAAASKTDLVSAPGEPPPGFTTAAGLAARRLGTLRAIT
jgi:hypothetical protein